MKLQFPFWTTSYEEQLTTALRLLVALLNREVVSGDSTDLRVVMTQATLISTAGFSGHIGAPSWPREAALEEALNLSIAEIQQATYSGTGSPRPLRDRVVDRCPPGVLPDTSWLDG